MIIVPTGDNLIKVKRSEVNVKHGLDKQQIRSNSTLKKKHSYVYIYI